MAVKLLGISGKIGAGKDTLCDYLISTVPHVSEPAPRIVRIGLADPIKDILVHTFNVPRALAYGSQQDKAKPMPTAPDKSIRTGMKIVGQALRTIEDSVWTRRADEAIHMYAAYTRQDLLVVVPDIRFHVDVDWIRRREGKIVRLLRATDPDDTHESEVALDDYGEFNLVVDNRKITAAHTGAAVIKELISWGWINASLLR
jgi:hypothetical protein